MIYRVMMAAFPWCSVNSPAEGEFVESSLGRSWGARTTMSTEPIVNQTNSVQQFCVVEDCRGPAAAALDEQSLCLDHFLSRCYRALEAYEGCRDHAYRVHDVERAQRRRFLDECSAQALHVGLRNENLSNLQRSRLLDVLLWAGELSECVRASQFGSRADHEHRNAPTTKVSRGQSTGY